MNGVPGVGVDPEVGSAIEWKNGVARIGPGSYSSSRPLALPDHSVLTFDRVIIKRIGDCPAFVIPDGTSGVQLAGNVSVDGSNLDKPVIRASGASGFRSNLEVTISRTKQPFLLLQRCQDAVIAGSLHSEDSPIIRAMDTSTLEIRGVTCAYRFDPKQPAIRIAASGTAGVVHDVTVHDCLLDGGGVFNAPGALMNISADLGQPYIEKVRLDSIEVRNTIRPRDGVDVVRCRNVTVSRVFGHDVNDTLSLLATDADVTDVVGYNCYAQAVAVGDPTYLSANEARCRVRRTVAINCGRGYTNPASSGLAVQTTGSFLYSDVLFEDCTSQTLGSPYPLYGFSAYPGTRNLVVNNCRFEGVKAPMLGMSPVGTVRTTGDLSTAPEVRRVDMAGANPFVYTKTDARTETVWMLSDPTPEATASLTHMGTEVMPTCFGRRFDMAASDTLEVKSNGRMPLMVRVLGLPAPH